MNQEMVDYIRQRAQARGIDPNIALRVVAGEGGLNNPYRHGEGPAPSSQDPSFGRLENSYGPLQLYISGNNAGMGDRALAAGIDPRTDWKGGVDFGLNEAAKSGWGQWYGAKKAGITGFQGIDRSNTTPLAYNTSNPGSPTPVPGTTLNSSTAGPQSAADGSYVPPLPPATNIPDPGVPHAIAEGPDGPVSPNAPQAAPTTNAAVTSPAPSLGSTVMSDLKGGNFGQALGALGSNKNFMGAIGGLAKTMDGGSSSGGQQQQQAQMQAPPIDTNSSSIAQAAPQLMAQLMARRRIPGMSIGGMPMGMG